MAPQLAWEFQPRVMITDSIDFSSNLKKKKTSAKLMLIKLKTEMDHQYLIAFNNEKFCNSLELLLLKKKNLSTKKTTVFLYF